MTLNSTTTKVSYAGDGANTAFDVTFKFLDNSHVTAILRDASGNETTWVEGTQYTLTGAGDEAGGTLTVETVPVDYTPAAGETLVIKRAAPETQQTALPLGGAFSSENVEQALDLLTMLVQAHSEEIARAVLLKATSAESGIAIPDPEAAKFLRWDALAQNLENAEITGAGSIGIPVSIAQGGTSAATAAAARSNLAVPPNSRAVAAAGLATGGGDLTADRTITVPPASQVEAEAGADNTKAMTPLRTAQAIGAMAGKLVDRQVTEYVTYSSHTTVIPADDTVPQNTEGEQIMTLAFTPKDAANRLLITVVVVIGSSIASNGVALFQDSAASAIASTSDRTETAAHPVPTILVHEMSAGTISSTTFKVRVGPAAAGTLYVNGDTVARRHGGAMGCYMIVEEYKP